MDQKASEQQPESAAEHCQKNALGQELPHEAPSAGAKREADCNLSPAGNAARHEDARQIGSRNQQHDSRYRHQRGGKPARNDLLEGIKGQGDLSRLEQDQRPVWIRRTECLLQLLALRRDDRWRLRGRHAGLQAPDRIDRHPIKSKVVCLGRLVARNPRHDWNPILTRLPGIGNAFELGSHHPNDGKWLTVNLDDLAQHTRIGIESRLPQSVTDNGDGLGGGRAIVVG